MIGQTKLLGQFDELARKGKLSRFIILVGDKGMGKTALAKKIFDDANMYISGQFMMWEMPDVKIDTVREMIKQSYTVQEPTVYIISNADDMSVGAKNALLKITEEPPNNAYFIMTLNNINNTLETIRSRASIYTVQPYTNEEKAYYLATLAPNLKTSQKELILEIATSLGDIRSMLIYGVEDFYSYVEKVVDNIAEVSGANAFKIADKVALKAEDKGYELELFFKMFSYICLNQMHDTEEKDKYLNGITITNKHLLDLNIRGVNRQFVIDSWILEIRRAWM